MSKKNLKRPALRAARDAEVRPAQTWRAASHQQPSIVHGGPEGVAGGVSAAARPSSRPAFPHETHPGCPAPRAPVPHPGVVCAPGIEVVQQRSWRTAAHPDHSMPSVVMRRSPTATASRGSARWRSGTRALITPVQVSDPVFIPDRGSLGPGGTRTKFDRCPTTGPDVSWKARIAPPAQAHATIAWTRRGPRCPTPRSESPGVLLVIPRHRRPPSRCSWPRTRHVATVRARTPAGSGHEQDLVLAFSRAPRGP